ncbi:MAG: DNRLRE domain-containing protein [Planctomycetota bacterium]
MKTLRITPVLALALSAAVSAQQITLDVVADTFIDKSSPSTNYNGGLTLEVAKKGGVLGTPSDKRTLLKFDLSGISAIPLRSAKLQFPDVLGTGGVEVHRAQAAWGESTVTWSNQPSFSTEVEASFTSSPSTRTRTLDVTSAVQSWLDGAESNHGFVLTAFGSGASMWMGPLVTMFTREVGEPIQLVLEPDYLAEFGNPCGFDITASGAPMLGSSYTIRASGGAAGTTILTVGATQTAVPFLGGCSLLTSLEATVLMPSVSGEHEVTFPVSSSPTLVGTQVYHQAFRVKWVSSSVPWIRIPEWSASEGIAVTFYDV